MALNSNSLPANKGGKDFVEQPVIDVGNYPARISQIIDLGLQSQRPYKGQEKPPANMIMISYELVDCFMVDESGNELDDKPRWISEQIPIYNLEADKAKSTLRYRAADPENEFNGDFSKLGAAAVNVSIVHNKVGDKLYTNIAGINTMRSKDAAKCTALKKPAKVFDLDDPDMEVFGSLPEWVQEKIKGNLRFNGSKLQAALGSKPEEAPKQQEKGAPPPEEGTDDAPWD